MYLEKKLKGNFKTLKIYCLIFLFSVSVGVAAINIAIETHDLDNLLNCLVSRDVSLHSVTKQCIQTYMDNLVQAREKKMQTGKCLKGNFTIKDHSFVC